MTRRAVLAAVSHQHGSPYFMKRSSPIQHPHMPGSNLQHHLPNHPSTLLPRPFRLRNPSTKSATAGSCFRTSGDSKPWHGPGAISAALAAWRTRYGLGARGSGRLVWSAESKPARRRLLNVRSALLGRLRTVQSEGSQGCHGHTRHPDGRLRAAAASTR